MTIEPGLIISFVAVIVSIISVVCAIIFSAKNSRRTDTKDIEERVRENTRINMKLDDIAGSIRDVKNDLVDVKKEMQSHNNKILKLEESVKSAHHRLDEMVKKCIACGGKCHDE